jgi:hypothetical protein
MDVINEVTSRQHRQMFRVEAVMATIAHANLRRSGRDAVSTPISLVKRTGNLRRDDSATVVDASLYGMKIRTAQTLVPGEWVGVVAKAGFPHAIPARVVWVREDESSHWIFAGIEFQTSRCI